MLLNAKVDNLLSDLSDNVEIWEEKWARKLKERSLSNQAVKFFAMADEDSGEDSDCNNAICASNAFIPNTDMRPIPHGRTIILSDKIHFCIRNKVGLLIGLCMCGQEQAPPTVFKRLSLKAKLREAICRMRDIACDSGVACDAVATRVFQAQATR